MEFIKQFIANYGATIIYAIFTAIAGFLGVQVKAIYQKCINDQTKKNVVKTCVKAVEQLYHDLDGADKLQKAQDSIIAMLGEKGIAITELEMNLLIESCIAEFNYNFSKEDIDNG